MKKRKTKKKDYKLIIMIFLLVITIGLILLFNPNIAGNDYVTSYTTYQAKDGKEVTLNHFKSNRYEVISDDKVMEVLRIDGKITKEGEIIPFIVYGNNCWYLMNLYNREIISYYESNNKIYYNKLFIDDELNDKWIYAIYDIDSGFLVKVVDVVNGDIIVPNAKESIKAERIEDNIYIVMNDKVKVYDLKGKFLKSLTNMEYNNLLK